MVTAGSAKTSLANYQMYVKQWKQKIKLSHGTTGSAMQSK